MQEQLYGEVSLNELLDEIESQAQQQQVADRSANYWVCKRRHPRNTFRAACQVRFFPQGFSEISTLPGRTRNISRGGVGLLVRRVFRLKEPVEVEISLPDRAPMFLGGLVRFCRYAGRGYYEIGICLHAAGSEPIFSLYPSAARDSLEWLRSTEPPPSSF